MRKPPRLKSGDTIGIVAPASPAADERREQAQRALEALGFRVKLGRSCYYRCGYLAGWDELRADDINAMFADTNVRGIICLRGGYGSLRILPMLDYQLIQSNPKVFIGYSDITALHIAINQLSEVVTFHGPMAASDLACGLDEFSQQSLLKTVAAAAPVGRIGNPDDHPIACLVPGTGRGPIVGGNLAVVAATLGTPYEIDTKGKLLLLEDVGEPPYRIDRMLTQLALAGKLAAASGIILGSFVHCDANPNESKTLAEVLKDIMTAVGKPAIWQVQSGHCRPMLTLPLGITGELNADKASLVLAESAVVDIL